MINKKSLPKTLTIIIPAYNEVHTIEECVRRVIAASKRGLEFDIVISDNVSTDGTRELLKKFDDHLINNEISSEKEVDKYCHDNNLSKFRFPSQFIEISKRQKILNNL